jgi:hypothetical protein
VRLRHPEAQLGEFHEVTANWENECKSEPVESTEEQFLKMLNILPPVAWTTRADGESFKMSERLYGMITSIYARITEPTSAGVTNRYFHLNDSILTPHDEIITRCSRLLADPPPSILN